MHGAKPHAIFLFSFKLLLSPQFLPKHLLAASSLLQQSELGKAQRKTLHKQNSCLQTLRYSLDVLRRRAALNGFRAGIIAYLLEGRKETERAIKFAVWYAERCLHYQLLIWQHPLSGCLAQGLYQGGSG